MFLLVKKRKNEKRSCHECESPSTSLIVPGLESLGHTVILCLVDSALWDQSSFILALRTVHKGQKLEGNDAHKGAVWCSTHQTSDAWEGGSTQRGSSLQAFAVLVAVCDIAVSAASVLCSFPLTPVTWSTSGYSYRPHKCGFCKGVRQGEMKRIWETVHGTGHSVTSGFTGDGGGEKMGLHWGCPIQ